MGDYVHVITVGEVVKRELEDKLKNGIIKVIKFISDNFKKYFKVVSQNGVLLRYKNENRVSN